MQALSIHRHCNRGRCFSFSLHACLHTGETRAPVPVRRIDASRAKGKSEIMGTGGAGDTKPGRITGMTDVRAVAEAEVGVEIGRGIGTETSEGLAGQTATMHLRRMAAAKQSQMASKDVVGLHWRLKTMF